MSQSNLNTLVLALAHQFIAKYVKAGDFCIDATAGRGGDTAYLCALVGPTGKVLAMDIQQEAVDSTTALLNERGYSNIGRVVLDGHEHMSLYAQSGTVSCITFNFGWLPGGNHQVFTYADTSIKAVAQGLELLKPGGIMSLCIYYGRDCGFEERDALLGYLATVDCRSYTVIVASFHNRPNNPPIPVFVIKDE